MIVDSHQTMRQGKRYPFLLRIMMAIISQMNDELNELENSNQIAFRYCEDINGSARNIAGIFNKTGNVLGMMPHPERAIDPIHGGTDGLKLFESLLS